MKPEYLMEYTVNLQQPVRNTGAGPFGARGLAVVTGGTFEGPRLKGEICAGGGDWWLRGSDGVLRLDARVTFETDDGALIYAQYPGVLRADGGRPLAQPDRYRSTAMPTS